MLDPSAYLEDGLSELIREFGIVEKDALSRYNQIIHLVSLSVLNSDLYQKFVSSNPHRVENVDEARGQEEGILQAWRNHPNRVVLSGKMSVNMKRVMNIIESCI